LARNLPCDLTLNTTIGKAVPATLTAGARKKALDNVAEINTLILAVEGDAQSRVEGLAVRRAKAALRELKVVSVLFNAMFGYGSRQRLTVVDHGRGDDKRGRVICTVRFCCSVTVDVIRFSFVLAR
jgi:hypothetical protein